jgi:transcriptional regulator with XRE-family HTH domain
MLRPAELGASIRRARRAQGLTQASVAQAAGVARLTLNQLENGVFPDLGIKKVNTILEVLGLELHVQSISREPKNQDFLSMASGSASVSLKECLHAEELEHALLTGKVPRNKEAHLITLLEEAPLWMLEGLVEQVSACSKPGKVQKNVSKLAQTLGVSQEIGQWKNIA